MLPVPAGPAGRITRVTWDGLAMSAGLPTERDATARAFLKFVLSDRVQSMIGEIGRAIPARKSGYDSFATSPAVQHERAFSVSMESARLQPSSRRFRSVDRALNEALGAALRSDEPVRASDLLQRLSEDPRIRAASPAMAKDGGRS